MVLNDESDSEASERQPDAPGKAEHSLDRKAAYQRVVDPYGHAAQQRVGDADADEPGAERRHERGHLEADMDDAIDKADGGAHGQHQKHREHTEVVVVHAVEHGHRQDHGGEGEDSLDRQIDRSHQDDEGFADAENKRDRRVLAHPHEVSEGEKVAIDDGDDHAQKDEHHRRRPSRHALAPPSRRASSRRTATFGDAFIASPSAILWVRGRTRARKHARARVSCAIC